MPTTAIAYFGVTDTVIGSLHVAGNGERLVAIKFDVDEARLADALTDLHRELHAAFTLVRGDTRVAGMMKQVRDYVAGTRTTFDLELDLSWVTPFRRDVLLACAAVPRGQVATYADLAARVGNPRAVRAVGSTMRTNPIPIVIPCHRIVASGGGLGGFGGGLDMKRQLLALEGASWSGAVSPRERDMPQLERRIV